MVSEELEERVGDAEGRIAEPLGQQDVAVDIAGRGILPDQLTIENEKAENEIQGEKRRREKAIAHSGSHDGTPCQGVEK